MPDNEIDIAINARDNASRVFSNVESQAGGLGRTLGSVGKIAGGFLAAQVVTSGVRAFTGYIGGAVKAASDLGESLNAVEQIFEDSSDVITNWGKTTANSYGLSQRAFQEMATPIGAILKNAGFSLDETAAQTINLSKRAADMASVFNTDVGDALAAIQSGLIGQVEPLRRYGVNLTAAAVQQRALADSGKDSVKALTDLELKTAALAIVMEQTASVEGDFVNTSDQLANAQRVAAAKSEELAAKIGEKLLPITLKITQAKLALLGVIADYLLPAMVVLGGFIGREIVPRFKDLFAAAKSVVEPILSTGAAFYDIYNNGSKLPGVLGDIQNALAQLKGFILGVVSGFKEMDVTSDGFLGAGERVGVFLRADLLPALRDIANFIRDEFAPAFLRGLQTIGDFLQTTWLPNFISGLGVLKDLFLEVVNVVGPAFDGLADLIGRDHLVMIAAFAAIGAAFVLAFGPAGVIAVAIAGTIAAIGYLSEHWDELKSKADEVFSSIGKTIEEALGEQFVEDMSTAGSAVRSIADEVYPYIRRMVEENFQGIIDITKFLVEQVDTHWNEIKSVLNFVIGDIITRIQGLGEIIGGIAGIVAGMVRLVSDLIHGDFDAAWEDVKGIVSSAFDTLKGLIDVSLGDLPKLFYNAAGKLSDAAGEMARSVINAVINWFETLPDKLYQIGVDAVQGFIDGMKSLINEVGNAALDIANTASFGLTDALLERSPSKVFFDIGANATQGFVNGLKSGISNVQAAIDEIAATATGGLSAANAAYIKNALSQDISAGQNVTLTRTSSAGTLTSKDAAKLILDGLLLSDVSGGGALTNLVRAVYEATGIVMSPEKLQEYLGTSIPGPGATFANAVVMESNLEDIFGNYIEQGFDAWTAAVSSDLHKMATQAYKASITAAAEALNEAGTFAQVSGLQLMNEFGQLIDEAGNLLFSGDAIDASAFTGRAQQLGWKVVNENGQIWLVDPKGKRHGPYASMEEANYALGMAGYRSYDETLGPFYGGTGSRDMYGWGGIDMPLYNGRGSQIVVNVNVEGSIRSDDDVLQIIRDGIQTGSLQGVFA